jgi:hypothetical protein
VDEWDSKAVNGWTRVVMLFRDLESKRMVKFKDTRPNQVLSMAQSVTQHGASELPAATWRFGVHDSDWRFAWHDAVAAT